MSIKTVHVVFVSGFLIAVAATAPPAGAQPTSSAPTGAAMSGAQGTSLGAPAPRGKSAKPGETDQQPGTQAGAPVTRGKGTGTTSNSPTGFIEPGEGKGRDLGAGSSGPSASARRIDRQPLPHNAAAPAGTPGAGTAGTPSATGAVVPLRRTPTGSTEMQSGNRGPRPILGAGGASGNSPSGK